MANGTTRLNVTEFDFDRVKTNLKTFLKAQTEFKDYDFEGSGMNILLDTLAYNTHTIWVSMQICLQTKCSLIVQLYVQVLYPMQKL